MSDVRKILEGRRAAIAAELDPLKQEYVTQREKLLAIEARVRVLLKESDEIDTALKSLGEPTTPRLTIMEAILTVLDHKPNGMTAVEILAELNEKYFAGKLVRTSLSPQLSRLKDRDGKIELRGDRWFKLPTQPNLFSDPSWRRA